MSAQVRLTNAELVEVHDLLAFVLRRGGNDTLESAFRKLRKAGLALRCVHCRERMTRRRDKICDACNTYRHANGELPADPVLSRRWSA